MIQTSNLLAPTPQWSFFLYLSLCPPVSHSGSGDPLHSGGHPVLHSLQAGRTGGGEEPPGSKTIGWITCQSTARTPAIGCPQCDWLQRPLYIYFYFIMSIFLGKEFPRGSLTGLNVYDVSTLPLLFTLFPDSLLNNADETEAEHTGSFTLLQLLKWKWKAVLTEWTPSKADERTCTTFFKQLFTQTDTGRQFQLHFFPEPPAVCGMFVLTDWMTFDTFGRGGFLANNQKETAELKHRLC